MAFLSCLTKIVLEVVDSSYYSRVFRGIVREDLEENLTSAGNYSLNYEMYRNYTHFDSDLDRYFSTSMVNRAFF